ncbi:protein kinase, AMP-activated, alpha 2 catalytic subunit [Chytriomyces hyalinus]|nr:protein kinase, AMP-activated, alpha 2 catalytic subunit [Chytriomyces hyalinus]
MFVEGNRDTHVLANSFPTNLHAKPPPSLRQFLQASRKTGSAGSFHPMQESFSPAHPRKHAQSEVTLAEDLTLPPPSLPFPQEWDPEFAVTLEQAPPTDPTPEDTAGSSNFQPMIVHEGPRVGDFILTDTLGEGTFGKVKLGVHWRTGEKVAVKAIQKSKIKTVKQMNSVQREVRLMKLLKHPHIVDVKETLEDENEIFLVMEYASGGELFDYIAKQCQQDENMARVYFRQVVSAINYCHQNSIIHRDLKPENLLLDKDGNIKIIDFGFGNTFHRDRTLDTYCGSPYYAAPEMVKGIPYTGPEVDIWSMGVILYALITGNLPFDSRDMPILYSLIAKGDYQRIRTSDTANDLVSIMLVVDPTKRAKIAQVIDHPWTNYGYTEKIDCHIVARPAIVDQPSASAISELVSYGINEREIKRLLSIDCGLHPIKSLYFLVADYLGRIERHKLKPGQSLTALQPIAREDSSKSTTQRQNYQGQQAQQQQQNSQLRPTSAPVQINTNYFYAYQQHQSSNASPVVHSHSAMSSPYHAPQYNFMHPHSQHSMQFYSASNSPAPHSNPHFDSPASMHAASSPGSLHYPYPTYQQQQQQQQQQPFYVMPPPSQYHYPAQMQQQSRNHQQQHPQISQLILQQQIQRQHSPFQNQSFGATPVKTNSPASPPQQQHHQQQLQGSSQNYEGFNFQPVNFHQPSALPRLQFQTEQPPVLTLQQQVILNPPCHGRASVFKSSREELQHAPEEVAQPLSAEIKQSTSPGGRLFKAIAAVAIRTASAAGRGKIGRSKNGEDEPSETGMDEPAADTTSDDRPRSRVYNTRISSSIRPGAHEHTPSMYTNISREYNRTTDEGSDVVWGMKWTAAHRPPVEEDGDASDGGCGDDEDYSRRGSVTVRAVARESVGPRSSVAQAREDDGKSGVAAARANTSLIHRLFGKK